MSSASAPLRLRSPNETKSYHWSKLRAMRANEKQVGFWLVYRAFSVLDIQRLRNEQRDTRMRVTIARIGPRLMDRDNNVASMKGVIDGIAYALGIDDGSDWYEWRYEQRKGRPKEYAVEVTLEVVR